MIDFLTPIILSLGKDLSAGRMIESLILLAVIWSRLRPHLTKIENRLEGLESGVKSGFENGSKRFQAIEIRLEVLEKNKGE